MWREEPENIFHHMFHTDNLIFLQILYCFKNVLCRKMSQVPLGNIIFISCPVLSGHHIGQAGLIDQHMPAPDTMILQIFIEILV